MIPPAARCEHGSVWHCTCLTARRFQARRKRHKQYGIADDYVVDATGTRRRLEGLGTRGHSEKELAAELGVNKSAIGKLRRRTRVHRVTAAKIAALCDRLTQLPPPSGPGAQMAREHAERAGWWDLGFWDDIDRDPEPEPWDGIDETVVLNAAAGRTTWGDLDTAHKQAVVGHLLLRGMPFGSMAKLLKCDQSTPQQFWRRHGDALDQRREVA